MKLSFSASVLIDRIISTIGRVLLEASAMIGLLACVACARMGICATIHSLSYSAHAWRETYWSGVDESRGGFLAILLSFIAAVIVVCCRCSLVVGTNNTSETPDISDAEKSNTVADASANKLKETQENISILYFIGFVIASIFWAAKSSPTKTHWTGPMMGKVSLNSIFALALCIIFMIAGSVFISFYSKEETNT